MSENDPRLQFEVGFLRLAEQGQGPPARFLLIKDGDADWAGDNIQLDADSAETVIAEFEKHGNDLVIDYHHRTLTVEEGKTDKAVAAGWIKRLEYVPGEGLYAADVEWTKEAANEIRSKAYKYISPVLLVPKGANKPTQLHSVALTNRPRTRGMIELLQAAERLAERYERTADMADKKGEKPKDDTEAKAGQDEGGEGLGISPEQKLFIKLAMALGLSDEAQPADILAAAIEAVGGGGGEEAAPEEAEKKAAEKLGCKSLDEAKAKLGTNEALTKRVEAAEKRLAERDEADAKAAASVLVNEQVDAGKLLPDDEKGMASALKYAEKDPDGFAETFAAIPAIIAPGRVTAASGKPSSERDKLIKAASKEYAEDPMMRHGKTDIRYYINASLAEEGQPNLTDVEAEKLKGAA